MEFCCGGRGQKSANDIDLNLKEDDKAAAEEHKSHHESNPEGSISAGKEKQHQQYLERQKKEAEEKAAREEAARKEEIAKRDAIVEEIEHQTEEQKQHAAAGLFGGVKPEKITPQHCWELVDKDKNGELSKTEVKRALMANATVIAFLGFKSTESKQFHAFFSKVDSDADGSISRDEFLAHFDPEYTAKATITPIEFDEDLASSAAKLYDLIDINHDGNISGREMKKFLQATSDSLLRDYFGRDISATQRYKKAQAFVNQVEGKAGLSKEDFVKLYVEEIVPKLKDEGLFKSP